MQRQTKRPVMAAAALVLAIIFSVGAECYPDRRPETPEASTPTVPAAGPDQPRVSYWHVWTDENGVSHQKRCELSAFNLQSISQGAAPSWIDKQSTPGARMVKILSREQNAVDVDVRERFDLEILAELESSVGGT